ncbi:type II toxin-antitoxin system RelE/ParE family toxin [Fannyhessea vaginae]|uniref:type II toxin-antitoxin system RelE/ParE family toxin n=1 Tax=Fannyhessea vaginae TaxID=82135 RepID=UPI003A7FAE02
MNTNAYKLTFLPLFKEDLLETVDYISNTLQNPTAAHRLVDDIESAIDKRLESALLFAPYQSSTTREHPYYRIDVHNFSVFYVVAGDTMEVRRLLYAKRNIDALLE